MNQHYAIGLHESIVEITTKSGICSIFLMKIFSLHHNFLFHESLLLLCEGSSIEKILMKRDIFSDNIFFMKKKTCNG